MNSIAQQHLANAFDKLSKATESLQGSPSHGNVLEATLSIGEAYQALQVVEAQTEYVQSLRKGR